jgi:hypothetical protein
MKNIFSKLKNYITTMGWIGLPPSVLRYDLQMHALGGLFMIIPFYIYPHNELGLSEILSITLATSLSFVVAVLKETSDAKKPNNFFDWLDVAWTAGPTLVGSVLLALFT